MSEPGRWDNLLSAARGGDLAAWGEMLEVHRARLVQLAERHLRGRVSVRVEAADAVQQTFLDAHRNLDQFRGLNEAAFAAWVERILEVNIAHTLRDHLLLQKRSMRREQSLDDSHGGNQALGPQIDAGYSTPSKRAIRHEEEHRLLQELDKLPPIQREAVRLRHLEGWSLTQIAEHLGRTPVAIASLVKRGMQALRKHLDTETPDVAP